MSQEEMMAALRDTIAVREEHGLDTSEIRSHLAGLERFGVRTGERPESPRPSMSKAQLEAAIAGLDQSIRSLKAQGGDTKPVEEARDRLMKQRKQLAEEEDQPTEAQAGE